MPGLTTREAPPPTIDATEPPCRCAANGDLDGALGLLAGGRATTAGSHASPFDHRRALLNFLNCGKLEATSLESAAVVRVRQRHEWRHVGLKWLKLLATTKL